MQQDWKYVSLVNLIVLIKDRREHQLDVRLMSCLLCAMDPTTVKMSCAFVGNIFRVAICPFVLPCYF